MLKLNDHVSPVALATLKDSDRILGLAKNANAVAVALVEATSFALASTDNKVSVENRKLTMRRFQAATVAAYIVGKHESVKLTITEKRPGEWKLVKDAYSKAVKVANALNRATYAVPSPKASERKRITLGGKVMTTLDKSNLAALADPQFGDTPISTLISKVIEFEAPAELRPEAELLKTGIAPEAFVAELDRWLSDAELFAEMLPRFQDAMAAHALAAEAARAGDAPTTAAELLAQAA